jgi:hypothetical protein
MRFTTALLGGALLGAVAGIAGLFLMREEGSAAKDRGRAAPAPLGKKARRSAAPPASAAGASPAAAPGAKKGLGSAGSSLPPESAPAPTESEGAPPTSTAVPLPFARGTVGGAGAAPIRSAGAEESGTGAAFSATGANKQPRGGADPNVVEHGISLFKEGLDASRPVKLALPAGVTATSGQFRGLGKPR